MSIDWSTIALQTVNFAVLAWLLQRFLYRPVLKVIDARKAEVQQEIDRTTAAEHEAQAKLKDIQAQRAGIERERDDALKSAAAQAQESAQARRTQAEREAAGIIDSAHAAMQAERDGVLAEARRLALDLAVGFARRWMTVMPAASCADGWMERIQQHLHSIPPSELRQLTQQLIDGKGVVVVTSAPMPEDSASKWQAQLGQTLGITVPMTFEVNPELIAGATLSFPSAVLDFSARGALATLRSQVDTGVDIH